MCSDVFLDITLCFVILFFFFFQAEDGIRDWSVTGVQTCALPIYRTQSSFGIVYSAVAAVATAFNLKVANATEVVSVDESQFTVRQFGYIDFFLPGIIGFTVLTTPMFGMTSICAEYRTRRFFKLLATPKLSKAEWLAAKVVFS